MTDDDELPPCVGEAMRDVLCDRLMPHSADLETAAPVRHPGGFVRSKSAHIAFWLGGLRQVPTWQEIQTRWRVSRASAFRWAAFARDAAAHNNDEPRGRA